jgi:hypothetical protein
MEVLKLQPNRPEVIALRFQTGKPVTGYGGEQFMYSLTDGRALFVDPPIAAQIDGLSLGKGEPFEITKYVRAEGRQKLTTYEVKYLQPTEAPATPQASTRQAGQSQPSATPTAQEVTHLPQATAAAAIAPTRIMSALCAAIDAVVEAQAYATRKGLHIAFTSEDVRAIANTLHIDASKGGR